MHNDVYLFDTLCKYLPDELSEERQETEEQNIQATEVLCKAVFGF